MAHDSDAHDACGCDICECQKLVALLPMLDQGSVVHPLPIGPISGSVYAFTASGVYRDGVKISTEFDPGVRSGRERLGE